MQSRVWILLGCSKIHLFVWHTLILSTKQIKNPIKICFLISMKSLWLETCSLNVLTEVTVVLHALHTSLLCEEMAEQFQICRGHKSADGDLMFWVLLQWQQQLGREGRSWGKTFGEKMVRKSGSLGPWGLFNTVVGRWLNALWQRPQLSWCLSRDGHVTAETPARYSKSLSAHINWTNGNNYEKAHIRKRLRIFPQNFLLTKNSIFLPKLPLLLSKALYLPQTNHCFSNTFIQYFIVATLNNNHLNQGFIAILILVCKINASTYINENLLNKLILLELWLCSEIMMSLLTIL